MEILPTVEAVAALPLLGLFSSPEGLPEAEMMIRVVADYALDNCEISSDG